MTQKKEKPSPARKPRADAERNRLQLLATAKGAFAERGPDASLEEIARAAGVGIGTLYRHFPNRDALIAAVYRNETEQLAAAARRLAETQAPVAALRAWMLVFIDYIATKQGMYPALNSLVGGTSDLYAASGQQIRDSIEMLTGRAVASGEIELNIDPLELLRAVAAVANVKTGANWKAAATRLVDILVEGLRVSPGNAPADG
ncbi:TetR/AcrR family transcriptional regulator [Pararhizobium sp.]|uniref:TetR/AcrR family transcriptional regulator n=1 Tax=Pararhizobium sp. TaxID=1977563 RepID=UPI0027194719|nr:helix-turn-helix domain-containing protein [Pararhizobium sp.]MDO9417257.1 helix-turn-helix domain-containing protein [Pararhizobium sp.]